MKKLLLALSVASLFAAPVMAEVEVLDAGDDPIANAPAVVGPQGSVQLRGELQSPTCRIKDDNQTVSLDKLDVSDIDKGSNTGVKSFSIDLVECSPYLGKTVTLKLTPSSTSLIEFGGEKLLQNSTPAPSSEDIGNGVPDLGARNVGLKVKTANKVNALNDLSDLAQFAANGYKSLENSSEISFTFSVEYAKTTDAPATPGYVSATLPFTIVYK